MKSKFSLHLRNLIQYRPIRGKEEPPKFYTNNWQTKIDISTIKKFNSIASEVIDSRTTMLGLDRLYTLYSATRNIRDFDILIEVGVYKGGTSLFLRKSLEGINCEFHLVDTFTGHSHANPNLDNQHSNNSSFLNTSLESVRVLFNHFSNVFLHQCSIEDWDNELNKQRIAFIHLDVDTYLSTRFVLDSYTAQMKNGGITIVDDYYKKTCPGVTKAVDEFIQENRESFFCLHLLTGQAVIIKLF